MKVSVCWMEQNSAAVIIVGNSGDACFSFVLSIVLMILLALLLASDCIDIIERNIMRVMA